MLRTSSRFVAICLGLTWACTDAPTEPDGPVAARVTIQPDSLTIQHGTGTASLTAVVTDRFGEVVANPVVTWTTANATVATVGENGVVRAAELGRTTITAASGSARATVPVRSVILPRADLNVTSSHAAQMTDVWVARTALVAHRGGFLHAIAYHDFDGDGDTDVLITPADGTANPQATQLMVNDGSGNFLPGPLFAGASLVHARKTILGDFDGDGRSDAFIIGHGFDQPPFPGEAPALLLNRGAGTFEAGRGVPALNGFFHGGAAADVDGDGDLDVLVTDNFGGPRLLLNDGAARFTVDDRLLPGELRGGMFTAELVDVDADGYVDLLVAGHEHEDFPSQIRWGGPFGWSSLDRTMLPALHDYGVVIDIDVADLNGDGSSDVVLTRTGSTVSYQGYGFAVLLQTQPRSFALHVTTVNPTSTWFDWVRLQDHDHDGNIDLVVDDADRGLVWLNDGTADFTPLASPSPSPLPPLP